MVDVVIHRATSADGQTLIDLVLALADYEKLPPPDENAQKRLLIDAFAERPRFEAFIAEVEGRAAGYAFIFETYSTFLALPTLYLEDLFVLPAFRSQHVGLALFRYCAAEAARRGCGRMEWTVLDWNQLAIRFYDKQGAQHLKEWFHYRLTQDDLARLAADC